MKGYSEQRGVQTQVTFDADTGQFVQQDVVHDFLAALQPRAAALPDAIVLDLVKCEAAVKAKATPRPRKGRTVAAPALHMKRTG